MSEKIDVLRDLFMRLPLRDLAFGCRGAGDEEWQTLLHEPALQNALRSRLRSLAALTNVEYDDQADVFDEYLKRFCAPTMRRWHTEYILRSFRRKHLHGCEPLHALWQQRHSADATDGLAAQMNETYLRVRDKLEQQTLADERDGVVERFEKALCEATIIGE